MDPPEGREWVDLHHRCQKKRIDLNNNTPYNQFKLENLKTGDPSNCAWIIQSMDLYADNVMAESTERMYPESGEAFKDIEIAEIIPKTLRSMDFQIIPALPTDIHMDPQTGWIAGTAMVESPLTSYGITATKLAGGTVTKTFLFQVYICTGGKGLVTFRYRADGYTDENVWKLFTGRGTSDTLLQSLSAFPLSNVYYYVDFCKEDGIYTLQFFDLYGDGWQKNHGYTMTVDVGAMELDMEELKDGSPKPLSVMTVFSTFIPF